MYRYILTAVIGTALATSTAFAQHHGGGGGGHPGGGHVSGGHVNVGHVDGGHVGNFGGRNFGGHNEFRGRSFGGVGFGYPFGIYGGIGYPLYGGYNTGYYDNGVIPYSGAYYDPDYSSYISPMPSTFIDPSLAPNTAPAYPSANSEPVPIPTGSSAQNVPASNSATLTVIVPPNAQVWFNDSLSQQSGTTRVFTTQPLDSGKTYNINVRAQMPDASQPVQLSLQVVAGDNMTVDLTRIR